ncbi:MAG: peptide ABC transporter permease [Magnetococcales bacterium]|nr:peptide ABC transporter permease [Magnetococcales bacterium]|tara:strand:+ start:599063 stop:599956 length:894 start_codon:yes stop_codon:yes gene_type:complete
MSVASQTTETQTATVETTADHLPSFHQRMFANKLAFFGVLIIAIMAVLAILAPWIAPFDPNEIDYTRMLLPPSPDHIMGTDDRGRDVFSRMLYGAQISLLVGFVAVGISSVIGIFFGAIAGFYGGKVDSFLMRFVDVMLAFPSFFLILAVIAFLEPSIYNIMIVIGLTSWMGVTRLVRAEFLSLRQQEFVMVAETQGVSNARLMWRYMLPNAMSPVWVNITLGIAAAILVESGLSFLGIGVQPPNASWGNILTDGKANIEIAWWLSFFPGFAILLTVLGYNLLGEGLRDVLDPRLRK